MKCLSRKKGTRARFLNWMLKSQRRSKLTNNWTVPYRQKKLARSSSKRKELNFWRSMKKRRLLGLKASKRSRTGCNYSKVCSASAFHSMPLASRRCACSTQLKAIVKRATSKLRSFRLWNRSLTRRLRRAWPTVLSPSSGLLRTCQMAVCQSLITSSVRSMATIKSLSAATAIITSQTALSIRASNSSPSTSSALLI